MGAVSDDEDIAEEVPAEVAAPVQETRKTVKAPAMVVPAKPASLLKKEARAAELASKTAASSKKLTTLKAARRKKTAKYYKQYEAADKEEVRLAREAKANGNYY